METRLNLAFLPKCFSISRKITIFVYDNTGMFYTKTQIVAMIHNTCMLKKQFKNYFFTSSPSITMATGSHKKNIRCKAFLLVKVYQTVMFDENL